MFWHLIAALIAAVCGAGVALLLRSLTRKRLPKWIIPVFAGLAMLGYTIHFEYNWFEYKKELLPEGTVVVASQEGQMFWRPWTIQFPMPLAYTVLDLENAQIQDTDQGRMGRFVLYRFEKQHLVSTVTSGGYQLLCSEKVMFRLNEQGQAKIDTMTELPGTDPLYRAICEAKR